MKRNATSSPKFTRPQHIVLRLCQFLLSLFVAAGMAHTQAPAAAASQYVRASLEAETRSPAPGDIVTVAIVMDPKPGWHDYWVNPGDAGTPLELQWQLPAGASAGPVRAPVPETLIVSGFMNHIYKAKHAFLVDLKIPQSAIVGQKLDIKVNARWSACSDLVCVPESATLSVPMTIGSGTIAKPDRARFDVWRSALPVPLDRKALYAIDGNRIDIAIPYPRSADASRVWFFAQSENLFRYAAPQTARQSGDWLIVSGEVKEPFAAEIAGLLRFNDAQGLEVRATPGTIPTGGAAISVLGKGAATEGSEPPLGFGWILSFSVLGGLLLNLMPCVFPILGLKALSLAKMGGDEREARRDAIAYTVGIILSCLVLGGIMLALRAAGEEVGWAFQLQDPVIVLLLLLLMVAVTANLAGLFDVGGIGAGEKLTRKGGISGSFWTGVLAAVVATPCTGPFMAAAMGAALLLPASLALLIFAGLGFGLALPFLAIAFVPPLRKRMPRPGPWMVRFRQWMAVPMALTSLALLWLLYQLAGFSGVLIGGTAALIILSRLFELGRKQKSGSPRKIVVAAILGITVAALLIMDKAAIVAPAPQPMKEGSVAFDEERLASLRAEGKPVFLYFTADWCVTCKVNEKAAIDRTETSAAFAKAGIQTMVGDYTRRDPDITRFLAKHGRSGVPLYLYYPPNADARVLPQILTVTDLTALSE
ncbi:thiol:disulfide interchange protein [Sphingorhabdus wooponensis]|uniref:Thiol:disulfide interchange protein n=1 Tax=Sphingorhabdus wooponensis TaxID=940136 RepID=A0A3R8S3Q4_9SPHN|nr:thiol:disulfide interchange protein [Sphingorhabdus wooponensis]